MRHLESNYRWGALKERPYNQVVLTMHNTDTVFQKLRSARQAYNQTVTSFRAYISTTCEGTDINNYNKHMYFWTRLSLKFCAAIRISDNYLTVNASLEGRAEL